MTLIQTKHSASAAVFSPQSTAPKPTHLAHIRARLLEDDLLKPVKEAVVSLPKTWRALVSKQPELGKNRKASDLIEAFPSWIEDGKTEVLETDMSGLITLPLLAVIHIVQYLDYIQRLGISHSEFLESVESGGVQGYCIGLLSAIVVSSAEDEEALIQHAAHGIRLSLAIGAFGDIGSSPDEVVSNTLQVRLRNAGSEEDLVARFPGSYISTITDAKTMSIIAPPHLIDALKEHAETEGLRPRAMHIRSNLHNSRNTELAQQCSSLFEDCPFASPDTLQVAVRSNKTGCYLEQDATSLVEEAVSTVLASRCDWSLVMQGLADDLNQSGSKHHSILLFGMGDSVPGAPFREHSLDISKIDVLSLVETPLSATPPASSIDDFPPDSIAIVGSACRLPGANSLDELWDLIAAGRSRLEKVRTDRVNIKESYRASQDPEWTKKREFYGNFIDDVDAFDHAFFNISPREAKYMDPQQRLLLMAAFEAMDSSGYLRSHQRNDGDAVGCFLGASYTEYTENTSAYSPSAFTATSTIRAFLSGKISYHFGWTGPSEVIDTACSASIVAVHRAVQAINAGECPVALAGGVNIITGVNNYFDLGKASFLSQTGQCKPFDDSADGYCRADGVGLVVLKPLSKAVADGDYIQGVIPAIATNQGGIGAPGITVPDGIAQKALYRGILEKAGLKGEDISYVEAHGTGTQVGDPIEIGSIREVFGGAHRASPLHLGSLKANIGHSETAAGVASLLKVLSMVRNRGVPPLQGFKRLNHKIPALELDKMAIPTKLLPWDSDHRIACINSYGASGSNSALICSEWLEEPSKLPDVTGQPLQEYPILLSAASNESLLRYARHLADYITKSSADLTLGNLSYTLSQRRKHHRIRWSTTAKDLIGLIEQLRECTPADFVQAPQKSKKIVLTFSGQSRTTIGVSDSARLENPRFEHYIQQCNNILMSYGCPDLLPYLSQTDPISDPTIIQCGTVTVQYACAQCWIDGGLDVAGIVGHSLGELTALAISGALSLEDTLKVVYTRAEAIKAKWGPESGSMLAIHANQDTVKSIVEIIETMITNPDEALEIACYNSITSHIVVGKESSIEMAEKVIQQDARYHGLRYQRLNTSHGFHSRFTEPLLQDLIHVERSVEFRKPSIPLETSTQTPVDFAKKRHSKYLSNHAREPVFFVDAARRLESRLGECVWLEAGWNTPIVAMTKRAVANPSAHTFQAVTSPAAVAMELWREGIATTYWSFFTPKESGLKHIWLPPYSFDRPKYWLEHVDRAVQERDAAANGSASPPPKKVQQLVTLKKTEGTKSQFRLRTTTERYKRIVSGHAVRGKPLCPASMYMESAIMGTEQLGASLVGKTITFENVSFTKPLGCDENLEVYVNLEQNTAAGEEAWHYAVQSGGKGSHSEGDFFATSGEMADIQLYEMLIADKIEALRNDVDAERLRTATAYSIFSRVVEYSDLLRGISSITMGTRQALAQIKVPKSTFEAQESTVSDFYDAITLDTFIQVLGLLINSDNDSSADDEIYVASSIGKMVVSPTEFKKHATWNVYATYSASDSKASSGAVFVFSEDRKLVSFATKIQFMRIKAAKLEKVLESANPGSKTKSTNGNALPSVPRSVPAGPTSAPQQVAPTTMPSAPAPVPVVAAGASPSKIADLKSLISVYTGVPVDEMQDNQNFGDMGLDSLASMELADEMESKLGLKVETEDLLLGSVGSLIKLLAPSSGPTAALTEGLVESYDTCSESSDSIRNSTGFHTTIPATPAELHSNPPDSLDGSTVWTKPKHSLSARFKLDTMVYKEAEGIDIPADVYVPQEPPQQPMPVALMIHGGGHLTLSRRAVRPTQTKYLLSQGILPVSIDYRLCPQVNVIDGPVADTRDACEWAQRDLPKIMASRNIEVDASKLIVIGWSTGGTLAMTTAWTLPSAGLPPPVAILSFYCPVNYDPEAPIQMGEEHEKRNMSLSEIRRLLGPQPATSHASHTTDTTKLGWVQANDPRSELVLALIKEPRGMSLLFNGLPPTGEELPVPDAERAAALSPLVQVRKGNYDVPTYLIFGDEDEIAPFGKAVEFAQALKDAGVKSGFLPIKGGKHIFDLGISPGSKAWDESIGPGYDFLLGELENAHRRCRDV